MMERNLEQTKLSKKKNCLEVWKKLENLLKQIRRSCNNRLEQGCNFVSGFCDSGCF